MDSTRSPKFFRKQEGLKKINSWNCIGPLHNPVTWYKITYTGEQVAQWDFQNNAPAFVLEVPLRNLLSSICNFVPCDWVLQRAYLYEAKRKLRICSEGLFVISNKGKKNWNSDQFVFRRRYIIQTLAFCLIRSSRDLLFGWERWVILPTRKLRIFGGFSVIKE